MPNIEEVKRGDGVVEYRFEGELFAVALVSGGTWNISFCGRRQENRTAWNEDSAMLYVRAIHADVMRKGNPN